MGFQVRKKLDLSKLGEGWEGAHLLLRTISFAEIGTLQNLNDDASSTDNLTKVGEIVKSHIVGGKAFDGENLVDVTQDNVLDLPPAVINEAVELIVGAAQVDPKSLTDSKTPSSEISTETTSPDTGSPDTSLEPNLA